MSDYIQNFLKVRLKEAYKFLQDGDAFNVKGRQWAENYIEDISYLLKKCANLEEFVSNHEPRTKTNS